MNRKFAVGAITGFIFFMLTGVSSMANSVEEPQYSVLDSIDDIEIRRYEAVVQAVTTLPGSSHTSEGFRRLAGFIFGGNDQQKKIAMTAPVQETLSAARPEMAFTMPDEYTLEDLPTPDDSRVSLHKVPARVVAVVTFSGWATAGRIARFEGQLRATLEQNAIEVAGDASLNQYNPPWTLPFLRRNEIVIEVKPSSVGVAALGGDTELVLAS
jgi:hypothetical protein